MLVSDTRENDDQPIGRSLKKAWCYAPRKPEFSGAPFPCAI
jgi:hypothetical protein